MITFEGLDELEEALGKLETVIGTVALPKAVGRAAQLIRRDAVQRCPTNHGELRNSILVDVQNGNTKTEATVYTNKEHAVYVEFGTGPRGRANHSGITPDVSPTYRPTPWAIPIGDGSGQISQEDADRYHMPIKQYGEKDYALTAGQPAKPFMYPALKDNETKCRNIIINTIRKELKNL